MFLFHLIRPLFCFPVIIYRWTHARSSWDRFVTFDGHYRETARAFFFSKSSAPSTQLRCVVPRGYMR